MNIKEAEVLSGVSRRNIRFYEQKGLLAPERNQENGYREYGEADVERLKLIRVLRMVDMPLEQVREVVLDHVSLREAVASHRRTLKNRIKELEVAVQFCDELSSEKQPDIDEVLRCMEEPKNKEKLSTKGDRDYVHLLIETAVYLFLGLVPIGVGAITGPLAVFLYEALPAASYVVCILALFGWGCVGYWIRGQEEWLSKSILVHGITGLFFLGAFSGNFVTADYALALALIALLGYSPVMATCMPLTMAFGWTDMWTMYLLPFVMMVLSFACGVIVRSIKRNQTPGYSQGEECVTG